MRGKALDHLHEAAAGLHGVEKLAIEDGGLLRLADLRVAQLLLPALQRRVIDRRRRQLAMHRRKARVALRGIARRGFDLRYQLALALAEQRVPQPVTLLRDARHADARPPD